MVVPKKFVFCSSFAYTRNRGYNPIASGYIINKCLACLMPVEARQSFLVLMDSGERSRESDTDVGQQVGPHDGFILVREAVRIEYDLDAIAPRQDVQKPPKSQKDSFARRHRRRCVDLIADEETIRMPVEHFFPDTVRIPAPYGCVWSA